MTAEVLKTISLELQEKYYDSYPITAASYPKYGLAYRPFL